MGLKTWLRGEKSNAQLKKKAKKGGVFSEAERAEYIHRFNETPETTKNNHTQGEK
ncbi:hypothetical protein I6N95_04695 [Vagococcus sp. BWB3-3]|uniref:Uncharacterized protein n=1 Tax=Vagococcus allomyrinae TaxID=2794353 RepID=A0A940P9B1_9ENTE|nr:hypothetical protein [Vagococcus allomyrinae]MBP1040307.1 hypothetical protein [Vagococcus allomyrinae]